MSCSSRPSRTSGRLSLVMTVSPSGFCRSEPTLPRNTCWMSGATSSVPADKRKLLGFTDNRQDAALQAGHFNDFLFASLLRAATLAAVRKEGSDGLVEDDFGRRVQGALGFLSANR